MAPADIPTLRDAGLDAAALLFTIGVSLVAALFFGLVPSIRAASPRDVGAMGQRGVVGRGGRRWGRDALVLVQTASALVLLIGAGLLLRSFWTLTHVDPGYDTRGIFTFQIAPDREGVDDGASLARFHQGFLERIAAVPGVESVGLTMVLPLDEGRGRAATSPSAICPGTRCRSG